MRCLTASLAEPTVQQLVGSAASKIYHVTRVDVVYAGPSMQIVDMVPLDAKLRRLASANGQDVCASVTMLPLISDGHPQRLPLVYHKASHSPSVSMK
jgi:hypothetical protein